MEALKKVCMAGGVICLAGAMLTRSVGFVVVTVVLAAVAVAIELKD